MKKLDLKTNKPVFSWVENEFSSDEFKMIKNIADLPIVFNHISLMPDAHLGYGTMVGSVVATKGAVIPSAIGVDIGCGMMARKTPFKSKDLEGKLPAIRADIERTVPTGFEKRHSTVDGAHEWWGEQDSISEFAKSKIGKHIESNSINQLGTLGGGNHFIEICLDKEDNVWIMLHSGSRNIGKTLADVHINEAKNIFQKYLMQLPDPDLAYLAEGTPEFKSYWNDLQFAQKYAMKNRELMMDGIIRVLQFKVNDGKPFEILMSVNCHHNYAELENHYGQNVYVTRKGAVRAREGDFGIIPGSMGAHSFIVRGKGNELSFDSCSHGAGRQMSRNKAKEKFTIQDLEEQTSGIECRKDAGVIDEIPSAYKNIDVVMKAQEDLVEVVAELHQLICVKG